MSAFDCYKNSAAHHKRCLDYLKENGYLALGSKTYVMTQQTGECNGTMYMHSEIKGCSDAQLAELREFFGDRLREQFTKIRWNGWFVLISHTD